MMYLGSWLLCIEDHTCAVSMRVALKLQSEINWPEGIAFYDCLSLHNRGPRNLDNLNESELLYHWQAPSTNERDFGLT
jgi:hypothetical protein